MSVSTINRKRTEISLCRSDIFSALAMQASESCISFKSCITFSLGGTNAQSGEGEARACRNSAYSFAQYTCEVCFSSFVLYTSLFHDRAVSKPARHGTYIFTLFMRPANSLSCKYFVANLLSKVLVGTVNIIREHHTILLANSNAS